MSYFTWDMKSEVLDDPYAQGKCICGEYLVNDTCFKCDDIKRAETELWESIYKPIKNPFEDRGWDGYMFETYGKDLKFVLKQNPNNIWTWWDTDFGSEVVAGYHLVNRIGYFITEKQWSELSESYSVHNEEDNDE